MGWEKVVWPFFWIFEVHIKSGADHSSLTQPACESHNNSPGPVIIDDFKLANVAMLLRVLRNMVESSDQTWSTGEGMANHFRILTLRTP